MATYLDELVQKIVTKADLKGFDDLERKLKRAIKLNDLLAKSFRRAFGIFFGIQGIRSVIQTTRDLDLLQKSIKGLTGSTQDWQYLREEAYRTGTSLKTIAGAYKNFYSAARGSGFNGTQIQGMFSGLLTAGRGIGASQQQIGGAYAAWSNDEYALMFRGYPLKALKKAKGTILTSNQGFLKQDANAGRRGQNDLETVITLIDGLAEYKDARMDKTYYGTVSTETILKDCIETFGIPVGTIAKINHKDIMGRQYREKSVNVLNGLARLLGFKWKIINGMFYIFTQEEPEEVYGITLNSDNSSTPERQNDKFTTKKNKETKQTSIEKTYNGYMIKTRLLPFLNPGTWAFCDFGTRLQGTKYIYKVRHRGNNYGTVAETEIYCV